MNQYIKFIVRVLLTCFFIAFLGGIIQVFVTFLGLLVQYIVGWNQYVLGWLWGMLTMMVYLVLLGLHNKGLAYGNPHQAVAKARRQMMWRLALIGAFVVIGLQIHGVRAESLLISVVLIQPVLYIVFWRLSK